MHWARTDMASAPIEAMSLADASLPAGDDHELTSYNDYYRMHISQV